MRAKIKIALLVLIGSIGFLSLVISLDSNIAFASHLTGEEAAEQYDGWTLSECNNRLDTDHEREVCRQYYSGTPVQANSDLQGTRCDYNGEEGFITTYKYSEDAQKIGSNQWCNLATSDDITRNPIIRLINGVIQFMSAGIFIIGILMITVSGIQYITAGGNPEATKAARDKIGNVVIGLVLYFFFVAIIEYLVPGGVFG